jgi:hypothetical protein
MTQIFNNIKTYCLIRDFVVKIGEKRTFACQLCRPADDDRSNENFLYWQKQSVFPVLYRLDKHC